MCDHAHYTKLQDQVDANEERLEKLEHDQLVIDTKQDEQIKSLFNSVKMLRNVTYGFALIMLLTIIYGAIGPRGFNAVTTEAAKISTVH